MKLYNYWISVVIDMLVFLPAVYGILRFKSLDKPVKFFIAMLCVAFINEVGMMIVAITKGHNLYLYNFYTIIQIILLSFFFYYASVNHKRLITFLSSALVIVSAFDYVFNDGISKFGSLSLTLDCAVFIFYSGLSFYELVVYGNKEVLKSPVYWITGGVAFFFMANAITFAFSRVGMEQNYLLMWLFGINNLVNGAVSLFYLFGLWRSYRQYSYS